MKNSSADVYQTVDSVEPSPELNAKSIADVNTQEKDLSLPGASASHATKVSSIIGVLVSGIALFSDGYNAQIIGYMEPLFSDL